MIESMRMLLMLSMMLAASGIALYMAAGWAWSTRPIRAVVRRARRQR